MLFWIFAALIAAPFFDIPFMPVLIMGALIQAVQAYAMTKHMACINLAIGLVIVSVSCYVLIPVIAESSPDLQSLVETVKAITPWASGISAAITLGMATVIGVLGIPGRTAKPE